MGRKKSELDLLSRLPDEIFCHILSFLSTKRSVGTCVLSKRWRFLWAHVLELKFYEHNFSDQTQPLDIIYRIAMLHKAETLNTFELSRLKRCPSYQLDTLIIYLITKRNLRNLCLVFDVEEYRENIACTLPRLLLTSKTLVDLDLVSCGLIPSSGKILLPSLKKLSLSYVEYESDESLPHLLSGCPLLEELIVEVCLRPGQMNSGCVIVSSPTLKTLIVDFSELGDECPDEMLTIDVPALEYLTLDHCNLDSLKSLEKTMNSLVEAEISLNGCSHTCDIDCNEHIEFLSCLCRARCLKISGDFEETLVDIVGTGLMPKFVNLTKLVLLLMVDWYNVVKFLEVVDNLEDLIITVYELRPYKEPKRVPSCMLSRLRTVTMFNFSAFEDVFDTVRYILRNARALETMEINADPGSSDKDNFDALIRRISLFERGSTSCQLAFNKAD